MNTYTIDGNVYNEDGEFLYVEGQKPKWIPKTPEDAEFLMERLQNLDSDLLALQAKRQSLLDNIDTMIRQKQHSITGIKIKYGADLEQIAKANLPNKRSKTWTCPFGKIMLRKVKAKFKVLDHDEAARSLLPIAPNAVQEEYKVKVLVSELPKEWLSGDANVLPKGLEVIPEAEIVKIESGVKEPTKEPKE